MKEFIISNPIGTLFFILGFAFTIILLLSAVFVPQLPIGLYTNKLNNNNLMAQIILGMVAIICIVVSVISFSV